MKKIVFIGLLFFVSCTPVKRLERLHKKHPYIFENVKDTVKFEGEVDTHVKGFEYADTFNIMDIHQRFRHLNTTLDLLYKDSNVFFNLKADDTTVKAKYSGEIAVNKYEVNIKKRDKWKTAIIITAILSTLVVVLWLIAKKLIKRLV